VSGDGPELDHAAEEEDLPVSTSFARILDTVRFDWPVRYPVKK